MATAHFSSCLFWVSQVLGWGLEVELSLQCQNRVQILIVDIADQDQIEQNVQPDGSFTLLDNLSHVTVETTSK